MSDIYVLDACALIALLRNEEGAETVAAVYQKANDGDAILIMNKINLFEVYYGFYRDKGKSYAENILYHVRQSAVTVRDFNDEVFLEAGRIKTSYKMSLADSIAIAQAYISKGALLTADHHEFDVVEKNENIDFLWIR